MKKFIYFAAALTVLSSCNNSDKIGTEIEDLSTSQVTTFTAIIEGSTKATLNETTPNWEVGDVISIDGHEYTADAAGASSTFTGTGATEATHHAYFPSYLYDAGLGLKVIPRNITETWEDGKFNMPMYAESTNDELSFKNLCGVLKITIGGDYENSGSYIGYNVRSITISSLNRATSGVFTVNASGAAVLASPDAIGNTLTITYSTPVLIPREGKTFYVPVPAQTYRGLIVKINDDNDNPRWKTTTENKDIVVERNKIYPINFVSNTNHTPEYVTIGNLRWATKNLGASTVAGSPMTCYGDYYAWGETEPRYYGYTSYNYNSNYPSKTTMTFSGWRPEFRGGYNVNPTINGSDIDAETNRLKMSIDPVHKEFGVPWRTPTAEDFRALYQACGGQGDYFDGMSQNPQVLLPEGSKETTAKGIYFCKDYDGVRGLLFCDGSGAQLFFPAAGYIYGTGWDYAGGGAYYWSSTRRSKTSDKSYIMRFNDGGNLYPGQVYINIKAGIEQYGIERIFFGMPIRPVRNAPK